MMKQSKLTFLRSNTKRKTDNEPTKSEPLPKKQKREKSKDPTSSQKPKQERETKDIEVTDEGFRYSNSMKDVVKTLCKICSEAVSLTSMRSHTKSAHGMSIADYKEQHGNHRTQIIEKIYHKCGLCQQAILLDSDDIAFHLKKCHDISHKDYNAKFMKLVKEDRSSKSVGTKKAKPKPTMKKTTKQKSPVKETVETTKGIEEKIKDDNIQEVSGFEQKTEEIDVNDPHKEVEEFNEDEPGPSSGRRLSEEEREHNLTELWKLQRRILNKLHLDEDSEDEEDILDTSSYSRSC